MKKTSLATNHNPTRKNVFSDTERFLSQRKTIPNCVRSCENIIHEKFGDGRDDSEQARKLLISFHFLYKSFTYQNNLYGLAVCCSSQTQ